jgi:hypothetical protein
MGKQGARRLFWRLPPRCGVKTINSEKFSLSEAERLSNLKVERRFRVCFEYALSEGRKFWLISINIYFGIINNIINNILSRDEKLIQGFHTFGREAWKSRAISGFFDCTNISRR